jgi:hypothetical protein
VGATKINRIRRLWSEQRSSVISLVGRGLSALGALVTMGLVVSRFTPIEQGYYYTFQGLIALQIFLEMGMSGVVLTSASHEVAALTWAGGRLVGSELSLGRLAALWRITAWWYSVAAVAVLVIIIPVGAWFLNRHGHNGQAASWQGPWVALGVAAAGNVALVGLLAFVEGLGRVALAAAVRLVQAVVLVAAFAGAALLGWGLWSAAVMIAASALAGAAVLGVQALPVITQIVRTTRDPSVSWRQDLLPFQWRIAVSWMAGYAIFQMMTPAVFAYHGAAAAGRFGLGLQVATGISSTAGAWLQVRQSPWAQAVARQDWRSLDRSLGRAGFATVLLAILGAGAALGLLALVPRLAPGLGGRLPPLGVIVPLLLVSIISQWPNAIATYLRAHKREPFLYPSVALALLMIGGCLGVAPIDPAALGWYYCGSVLLVAVGGGTALLIILRRRWHGA